MNTTPQYHPSAHPGDQDIRLINGDCINILKTMKAASVDLVVTDPPYLVNYRSRDGRKIANDKDTQWLRPSFTEIARVLKPNRFCISFYGVYKVDRFLAAWRQAKLYPVAHLIFQKSYSSSQRFVRSHHECAYLLAKGRPNQPKRLINDVLPWAYTGNHLHPNQKPVSAIEPLIASFSDPGQVVLDPFMGSGTTGEAALRLNRRFIGIELDPTYYQLAAKRLRQRV